MDHDGTIDVRRAIQGPADSIRLRRGPQQYLGEAKVLAQKHTGWKQGVYTETSISPAD